MNTKEIYLEQFSAILLTKNQGIVIFLAGFFIPGSMQNA